MRQHPYLLPIGLSAILFTVLFHRTGIGLNLLLFEAVLALCWWRYRKAPLNSLQRITAWGIGGTAIMLVVHGSNFTLWMHLISLLLFVGAGVLPGINALQHAVIPGLGQTALAAQRILRYLPGIRARTKSAASISLRLLGPVILIVLVLVFMGLYRSANPHFDELMGRAWDAFFRLSPTWIPLLCLGFLLSAWLLLPGKRKEYSDIHTTPGDLLPAPSIGSAAFTPDLQLELRQGTGLLIVLNLLLLVMNALDLQHVWLGFTYTGQYLKQFVHAGTTALIAAIILGASVVLYYFRGNINHMERSDTLRTLAYVWLAQNAFLALSVGLRNYHYIQHFALAYKRIGVALFLIAAIAGLVFIALKLRHKYNLHYVVRKTILAAYITVTAAALVDWDSTIARYNMAHGNKAFIDLRFLSTLNPRALPFLDVSLESIRSIDAHNAQAIGAARYTRTLYMEPEEFRSRIAERHADFVASYPERSWRMWRWADAWAYERVK